MIVAGLTGGIGSGKSTFAKLLEERGAEVIDADELGRTALSPGRPGWHSVIDTFGDELLVPGTMEIDRGLLASMVFSDSAKLAALNAIVHPIIMSGIADTLEVLAGTDMIVIIDAALLIETGLADRVDVVIVVLAADDIRSARLRAERGMSQKDIEGRIAAQLPASRLLERADVVVNNDGSLEELSREADRVYAELEKRRGR
ncbi:MAG: dephospho-CoA kinase [Actinomycetota bacterium]